MTPEEMEAKLTMLDKKINITLNVLNTLMQVLTKIEHLRLEMIKAEQEAQDEAEGE
jgi:hypothetical protein